MIFIDDTFGTLVKKRMNSNSFPIGRFFVLVITVWNLYTLLYLQSFVSTPNPNGYNELQLQQQQQNCITNIATTARLTSAIKNDKNQQANGDNNYMTATIYNKHQEETDEKASYCKKEYQRVTTDMVDRVPGLTYDDYERSIAHVGNRYRLSKFVKKLVRSSNITNKQKQQSSDNDSDAANAVTVIVCGGSITMGHGVEPDTARYSDALEVWLNNAYPISDIQKGNDKKNSIQRTASLKHRVYNRGGHGANVSFYDRSSLVFDCRRKK
jgi:hypothetical protein